MNNKSTNLLMSYEASTEAIYELLNEVIKKPSRFINDLNFKRALASQNGIAKLEGVWECQTYTINKGKMTLNTLKKHAKNLFGERLEDGWDIINELRIDAKDAIESELNKENKPIKSTKTGLQAIVKENEDTVAKQKAVNFILLQAVSGAMYTIKTVSETTNKELREERALIGLEKLRAIVALNQPPYNKIKTSGTVVNIVRCEVDEL